MKVLRPCKKRVSVSISRPGNCAACVIAQPVAPDIVVLNTALTVTETIPAVGTDYAVSDFAVTALQSAGLSGSRPV